MNNFVYVCNKNTSLPAKTEKFFISEEKSLIGSTTGGPRYMREIGTPKIC